MPGRGRRLGPQLQARSAAVDCTAPGRPSCRCGAVSQRRQGLRARTEARGRLATIVSSSPNAIGQPIAGRHHPHPLERGRRTAVSALPGIRGDRLADRRACFTYWRATVEFSRHHRRVRSRHGGASRRIATSTQGQPSDHDDVYRRGTDVRRRRSRGRHLLDRESDIGERKAREEANRVSLVRAVIAPEPAGSWCRRLPGETGATATAWTGFRTRFSQRLHAVARAPGPAGGRNWEGAQLTDLVRSPVSSVHRGTSRRVSRMRRPRAGPAARRRFHSLTPGALHGLATSAAKYGACDAVPDGRVAVDWERGCRPWRKSRTTCRFRAELARAWRTAGPPLRTAKASGASSSPT